MNTTREVLAGGMIKGGMMVAHVAFATKDRSAEEITRFWSLLPHEVRMAAGGMLLAIKWYPFAHLIAVDRAIVDVYGQGNIDILRSVGAHSARLNLGGVYKGYRRDSIHEFLGNNARLLPQFQDFGQAAYAKTGELSGRMTLTGYQSYSPLYCASAIGFYQEALQIHGPSEVHIEETSCHCRGEGSCTFVLRWK
jgi:hypothetical protein